MDDEPTGFEIRDVTGSASIGIVSICSEVAQTCDFVCSAHFQGGQGFQCDANGNCVGAHQLSIYGIVNRMAQGLARRLGGHEVSLA